MQMIELSVVRCYCNAGQYKYNIMCELNLFFYVLGIFELFNLLLLRK